MRELDYEKMGMRIRQLRKAKGWSQDDLAKKCGISMSFLGHIERGTRIMSLETFTGICNALGAGADELLWGVPQPSDSLFDMWDLSGKQTDGQRQEKERIGKETHSEADGISGRAQNGSSKMKKHADSYSMYVRIMKSVAEIMNEA